MVHLDDEQALGFLRHQLEDDERARIERHIDACAECRQLLSALAEVVTAPSDGPGAGAEDDPPEDDDLRPRAGEVIAERFVLEKVIGRGGMGTVFRARDQADESTVALKVMRVDARGASRFEREARVLAGLRHPAVVRYLAHGRSASGEAFLAMEWLEGEDLGARLQRGPLPLAEALALIRQVAAGLAVTHDAGIVHRDIKPTNVFLRRGLHDGEAARATILDFGVARSTRPDTQATRRGTLLGTPGYMAPEQARGTRELDARADVFSLGCVLYECLTGVRAFAGNDLLEVLARVLLETQPHVRERAPHVPAKLDALVQAMLAKNPDERPRDCRALLEQLDAAERHETSTPAASPRRTWWTVGRVAAGVVVAISVLVLGASASRARRQAPAALAVIASSPTAPSSTRASLPAAGRTTPVLVTSFENRSTDPLFEQILPEALMYALNRSDVLEPLGGASLRQLAQDLGDAGVPLPLDETLGHALAVRDATPVALVRGQVTPAGAGYRLQVRLELVDAATDADGGKGAPLLDTAREASSFDELLPTLGALAWDIRRALGEAGPRDADDAVATDLSPSLPADAEMLLGERLIYSQHIDEGLTHLRRATELDPASPVLRGTYGGVLGTMRKPGAEKELATALATDQGIGRKEHLLFAGLYHFLRHDDEAAQREIDETIALRPHALLPRYIEGSLAERDGQWARALESARDLAALHPQDPASQANVVYGELLATDLVRARADGDRMMKSFPRLGTLAGCVAVVRALDGQVAQARAAWDVVAEEDPALASLGQADTSAFIGDWADARRRLRAAAGAVGATGAEHDSPMGAETWSALAEVEAHEGNSAAALTAAERALGPLASSATLYRTARLILQLRPGAHIAPVQARLDRGTSRDARVDARLLAAETALARRDPATASRELHAALALDDAVRIHAALGRAALRAGRFAEALTELQTCVDRRGEVAFPDAGGGPLLRTLPALLADLAQAQAAARPR